MPDLAISVIIPHLNHADALAECLAALASQEGEFSLAEIIVVDNNSVAAPADLCGRFHNVTLLHEKEFGPGPARNRGVSASSGEIIAFIDADCAPEADWLAAITRHFREYPKTDILGGAVSLPPVENRKLSPLEAYENIYSYRISEYVARRNFAGTGNLAMRRATFDAVGPFGGIHTPEDLDWGQTAHRLGFNLRFDPSVVVYHQSKASFANLAQKWDRQIAHYFLASQDNTMQKARIVAVAAAVAVSPLAEIPKILVTSKVKGIRERYIAFGCLVRIRLYRARRMLGMMSKAKATAALNRWNRP